MSRQARPMPLFAPGRLQQFNPFHSIFRLLTSVRFALALIGFIVLLATIGVLVPQVPGFLRERPAMRAEWVEGQQDRFGPLTPLLDRLGMFEIFASPLFLAAMCVLVVSIAVCSWSRFSPTWRAAMRPRKRVNDRYFDTAHHRAHVEGPADLSRLEEVLERRGYRVEVEARDGSTTYLFADRFRWASFGTFATHLSLLVFLIGGLMTACAAKEQQLFAGEGTTAAVFAPDDGDHMQLRVVDFVREQDAEGRDLHYETHLQVTRKGELVAEGTSTVNSPLQYGGFTFHQSSFSDRGVALEIRETESDRLLYSEVIALPNTVLAPRVQITDGSGREAYSGVVPPSFFLNNGAAGGMVPLPALSEPLALALHANDRDEIDLAVSGPDGSVTELAPGETAVAGPYRVAFDGVEPVWYAVVNGLPGERMAGGQALVQSYVTDGGRQVLVLVNDRGEPMVLGDGDSEAAGAETYQFGGRRDFSGITVRRDPGTRFIWVGATLLLGGLATTFYVPRRRLWGRVGADGIWLAGTARAGVDYSHELQQLAEEAQKRRRGDRDEP